MILTYGGDHCSDEVERPREVPPLPSPLQDPGRGGLRVLPQELVQFRRVHLRVVVEECIQNVVVFIPIFHLSIPLQEHKDGGSRKHVEDHDHGQEDEPGVVLSQVEYGTAAALGHPSVPVGSTPLEASPGPGREPHSAPPATGPPSGGLGHRGKVRHLTFSSR